MDLSAEEVAGHFSNTCKEINRQGISQRRESQSPPLQKCRSSEVCITSKHAGVVPSMTDEQYMLLSVQLEGLLERGW